LQANGTRLPEEKLAEFSIDWPQFGDVRALVLGGTGFIGLSVCEALILGGCTVFAVDFEGDPSTPYTAHGIPRFAERTIHADVTSFDDVMRVVAEARPDLVVHLAAMAQVGECMIAPLQAFRANALGTANVLEACRITRLPSAIIIASTDKVYGDWGDVEATDETPLRPRHPYDASKAAGDLLAQTYAERYGVPVSVTRCGNVYGPGDVSWDRLIPGTIRSLMLGRRPVIRSDGEYVREWNYAADIACAYSTLASKMLAGSLVGSTYTISNGQTHRVLDVVRSLQRLIPGGEVLDPTILNEARDETRILRLNSSRFREDSGWSPVVGLKEGLESTVGWMRTYLGQDEEEA